MSNIESSPQEIVCREGAMGETRSGEGPTIIIPELLEPRDVPLGGIRAMNVRRTLPQRARSLIGAWCFLDHYGPDEVTRSGGMSVPRHPHTGLQTVSWLFTGEIDHLDSAGHAARVRPGEMNLMTAGNGISHSEFSTPETTTLHGAQLWIALPDHARFMPPTFESHRPEPVTGQGWELRVFAGTLAGSTSPVATHTPLVGAELVLDPNSRLELSVSDGVEQTFEYGVLLDTGSVAVNGHTVPKDRLAYLPPGQQNLILESGNVATRVLIIGGEPFGEEIIMFWNFIGRTHEEIVVFREQWQVEIGEDSEEPDGADEDGRAGAGRHRAEQYGPFPDSEPNPLPSPIMPLTRLKPRR